MKCQATGNEEHPKEVDIFGAHFINWYDGMKRKTEIGRMRVMKQSDMILG